MILSSAPPSSEAEIPPKPKEPTIVPSSSLVAATTSVELKPASSRLATEVAVIFFRTVSVAVSPVSAELLGRYSFLPLSDLTRLLTMTLMTLMVSVELVRPMEESLDWEPLMMWGNRTTSSVLLSVLESVTACFAA